MFFDKIFKISQFLAGFKHLLGMPNTCRLLKSLDILFLEGKNQKKSYWFFLGGNKGEQYQPVRVGLNAI